VQEGTEATTIGGVPKRRKRFARASEGRGADSEGKGKGVIRYEVESKQNSAAHDKDMNRRNFAGEKKKLAANLWNF